jgi:hypothetical protein
MGKWVFSLQEIGRSEKLAKNYIYPSLIQWVKNQIYPLNKCLCDLGKFGFSLQEIGRSEKLAKNYIYRTLIQWV